MTGQGSDLRMTVTPAMLEAGIDAHLASGYDPGYHPLVLVVQEVFEAMIRAGFPQVAVNTPVDSIAACNADAVSLMSLPA